MAKRKEKEKKKKNRKRKRERQRDRSGGKEEGRERQEKLVELLEGETKKISC